MIPLTEAEIHSLGMKALIFALDTIIPKTNDGSEETSNFKTLVLEQFELNFYRCLLHSCPEKFANLSQPELAANQSPVTIFDTPQYKPPATEFYQRQLLLDNAEGGRGGYDAQ